MKTQLENTPIDLLHKEIQSITSIELSKSQNLLFIATELSKENQRKSAPVLVYDIKENKFIGMRYYNKKILLKLEILTGLVLSKYFSSKKCKS